MPGTVDPSALVAQLRRSPLSSAPQLMAALGVGSQASFSRLVARSGDAIVAIGKARARRYAAARPVAGLGARLPLFRVTAGGSLESIGHVFALAPEGSCVQGKAPLPRWMRGARGNGVFGGLPVIHVDQRPQGFLGGTFAQRHAALGLPDRPEDWTDDHALIALARAGDDLVGDGVLGDESARRLYAQWSAPPAPIAPARRSREYPALAAEAIGGVTPGSSAGGEQPKFGALVGDGSTAAHVLVKFSPSEFSASARRWCDLIVCEHLALRAVRSLELPAVASDILEGGSRVFLETVRFDRIGLRGRRPVVSLAAMNAEYVGLAPSTGQWSRAAAGLEAEGWLAPSTLEQVRRLELFGRFIANTDMHFLNVSFLPRSDGTLELAPVYDMLPMGYAPVAGELPARAHAPPLPEPGHEAGWRAAGEAAHAFWRLVADDERVSAPFRAIASQNAREVARALERFVPS